MAVTKQWGSNNSNEWNNSNMEQFLNLDYYNNVNEVSEFGLKDSSKKIIATSKFYLGGHRVNNVSHEGSGPYGSAVENYIWERGIENYNYNNYCFNNDWDSRCTNIHYCEEDHEDDLCSNERSKNWIGKIGLMYPSDNFYVYSNGVNNKCFNNSYYCTSLEDSKKGWIFNSVYYNSDFQVTDVYAAWLISPVSDLNQTSYNLYYVGNLNAGFSTGYSGLVVPTLFLKTNVKIVEGNGSEINPYKLGYTE